jgi:hypothetical protein
MVRWVGYSVPDESLLDFAQATSDDFMPSPSSDADSDRLLLKTTVARDRTFTPVNGDSCL